MINWPKAVITEMTQQSSTEHKTRLRVTKPAYLKESSVLNFSY